MSQPQKTKKPTKKLIPPPKEIAQYLYSHNKAGRPSLQSQMGLEDDHGRLDEMTAYTREAAAEHFDMRPSTYKDQSPAVLKTVKEQVMTQCAGMHRYQDGWPITRYIRIYLKNHHVKKDIKSTSRQRSVRGSKAGSRASAVHKPASKHTRPGPGRHSVGFNLKHEAVVPPNSVQREEAPVYPREDSLSTLTSLPSTYRDGHRDLSPEVPLDVPDAKPSSSVADFVANLKIPARDVKNIETLLHDMGIEDREYLAAFAMMETRDPWLMEMQKERQLTAIQMRLLQEGLDKLKIDVDREEV
ncbi:hypothetical protein C8Q76DRAFT_341915 [Earliella scabrosa]|nr:hypothetical protein C8Q76DRAFT_341915 [Earliella scabrosa]